MQRRCKVLRKTSAIVSALPLIAILVRLAREAERLPLLASRGDLANQGSANREHPAVSVAQHIVRQAHSGLLLAECY